MKSLQLILFFKSSPVFSEDWMGRVLKTAALILAFSLTHGGLVAQTVDIPDPGLEAAIRVQLRKPEGDITVADMESLTELNAFGTGIFNLTGLKKATNLTALTLIWTGTRDFSQLVDLTSLTVLSLQENKISDLSPLAGLSNLTALVLASNEISDLSPLVGLSNLKFLILSGNKISDLSPLSGLINLTVLDLSSNYIDITPGSPARQIIDELNAIEDLTVGFGSQKEREPLIGGIPIGGSEDWYRCDWWGDYNTDFSPWLFHAQHGFLYRYPESTNASLFVYDDSMNAWCWTSETDYPFIYAFSPPADNVGTEIGSNWLWYFKGSKDPRVFGVPTGDDAGSFLFYSP